MRNQIITEKNAWPMDHCSHGVNLHQQNYLSTLDSSSHSSSNRTITSMFKQASLRSSTTPFAQSSQMGYGPMSSLGASSISIKSIWGITHSTLTTDQAKLSGSSISASLMGVTA